MPKKIFLTFMTIACLAVVSSCGGNRPVAPVNLEAGADPKVQAAETPLQTLGSAKEYLAEGKRLGEEGNYAESLRNLEEAIRLEPRNQEAHALAGLAHAKLGKGAEAKREFQTVVQINPTSGEAENAKKWLDKFQKRLPVVVFPFKMKSNLTLVHDGSDKQEGFFYHEKTKELTKDFEETGKIAFDAFAATLADCGSYAVSKSPTPVDKASAWKAAADNGGKIAILGEMEFNQERTAGAAGMLDLVRTPALLVFTPYLVDKTRTYNLNGEVRVSLYETKNGQLIKVLTETMNKNTVFDGKVRESLQEAMITIFRKMAVEVHNTLL